MSTSRVEVFCVFFQSDPVPLLIIDLFALHAGILSADITRQAPPTLLAGLPGYQSLSSMLRLRPLQATLALCMAFFPCPGLPRASFAKQRSQSKPGQGCLFSISVPTFSSIRALTCCANMSFHLRIGTTGAFASVSEEVYCQCLLPML